MLRTSHNFETRTLSPLPFKMNMLLPRCPPHFRLNIVNPFITNYPRISGNISQYLLANASVARNPVRINNSDNRVELSLDLPGIKASDLKVNIENQVLTISGNRTVTRENLTSTWRFSRQFALDATVDASHLTANLARGVLTLSAPKIEKSGSIDVSITEKALGDQEEVPAAAADQENLHPLRQSACLRTPTSQRWT